MQNKVTNTSRQADAIEITPEMIEAGLDELRDHAYGGNLRDLVSSVYLSMEIARRFQETSVAASRIRLST